MKSQEQRIRRMLDDIGRALVQAINDSSKISGTIREIRQEGYTLHLVLGCLNEPATSPGSEAPDTASRQALEPRAVATSSPMRCRRPSFRLNSEDVSFLKSIGIDPTRAPRRRRKGGSPA